MKTCPRLRSLLPALALLVGGWPSMALAQDDATAAKRTEGRYFVELAEIMLTTEDFDLAIGSIDPQGPGAGEPAQPLVADLSHLKEGPPRLVIGLNRASGKTSVEFWIHDLHLKDDRIIQNFNADDQLVTTTLIPPGVIFQRQQPGPNGYDPADDYVPNYANDIYFKRRSDSRSGGITLLHNLKETERYRLRWLGGVKYAEIDRAITAQLGFQPETTFTGFTTQDFFTLQAKVNTHGIGPTAGLDGRFILDKKRKKWTVEGRGEVTLLPESTSAQYAVSMVDNSAEGHRYLVEIPEGSGHFFNRFESNTEAPIIPGVGSPTDPGDPFNALVRQQDFTEVTWIAEGRVGLRFQASKYFTIGVDAWMRRWTNLLTDVGVIDTIHRHATYEQLPAEPFAGDPQLRDGESVIHAPRFSTREDATWHGISLSMKFEF